MRQFLRFAEANGLSLKTTDPVFIAAYVRELNKTPSRKKLHLAAIRMLYDYLVIGGELTSNPASSVKAPKHVVKKGKTPVLTAEETRVLLDSMDSNTIVGARVRT